MANSLSKSQKADDRDTPRTRIESRMAGGQSPKDRAVPDIQWPESLSPGVPPVLSPFNRFEGISIFDDKGEVKRLVVSVVEQVDPSVSIERMRKMDFSFIFTLFKWGKTRDIEFSRAEIEASWDWRNGKIDEAIQEKLENATKEF